MKKQMECAKEAVAADWQRQLQVVEVEAVDARAKALMDYQNAMFAAAYCRRDNGRCEGCGE